VHQNFIATLNELMCREIAVRRLAVPDVHSDADDAPVSATVRPFGRAVVGVDSTSNEVDASTTPASVTHLPTPMHTQWDVLRPELEARYWRHGSSRLERTAVLSALREAFLKHGVIVFDDAQHGTPAGALQGLADWVVQVNHGLFGEMRRREVLLYRHRVATC
jgi:hypothetical protein